MLHAGWMHNYMRMYWAKKILECKKVNADQYIRRMYDLASKAGPSCEVNLYAAE